MKYSSSYDKYRIRLMRECNFSPDKARSLHDSQAWAIVADKLKRGLLEVKSEEDAAMKAGWTRKKKTKILFTEF